MSIFVMSALVMVAFSMVAFCDSNVTMLPLVALNVPNLAIPVEVMSSVSSCFVSMDTSASIVSALKVLADISFACISLAMTVFVETVSDKAETLPSTASILESKSFTSSIKLFILSFCSSSFTFEVTFTFLVESERLRIYLLSPFIP